MVAQSSGDVELFRLQRAAVLGVPQAVLQDAAQGPGAGPGAVQAEYVRHGVEAPGDLARVETVVDGRQQLEAGVAGQRLGVDGEPGGAVRGEHVLEVQVPVQEPVAGFVHDLAHGGRAVGEQAAGLRVRDALQRPRGLVEHGPGDVAEAAHGRRCRGGGEVRQQVGYDEDGLAGVGQVRQHAVRVQAFQQHGAGCLVVVEQTYRPVAGPQAQGDRLALALLVAELELQHGRRAVRAADRQDEGADAVHRRSVEAQLPALQEARRQIRQSGHEVPARGSVVLLLRGRQPARNVNHASDVTGVRESAHAN